MSNHGSYYYNVTPFGIKNTDVTYHFHIDVVFSHQIGQNLEVYVDNMIANTIQRCKHAEDLEDVLQSLRKYDIRLNPTKCSGMV